MNRKIKTVIIASIIVAAVLIAGSISYALWQKSNSEPRDPKNCGYIVGDGYAMGTDPYPVVIGGNCDGAPLTSEEIDRINKDRAMEYGV